MISPSGPNDHLRTVIVAPMTLKRRAAPFRVPLTFKRKQGLILLDQIRTVDKLRLVSKDGAVLECTLSSVLQTLQEVFAESCHGRRKRLTEPVRARAPPKFLRPHAVILSESLTS